MAKQVQIRRDSASSLATTTPAEGELAYNLTDKRLHAGDGATAGGVPHVNYRDEIAGTFVYAQAGGSANALTISLEKAPSSYQAGMAVRFTASSTNSSSATINVNGMGSKSLRKASNGTIAALVAGDIIDNGCYIAIYDGTYFQLVGGAGGINEVRQADLATSIESLSLSLPSGNSLSMPGLNIGQSSAGEYAFDFQHRCQGTDNRLKWYRILYGQGDSSTSIPAGDYRTQFSTCFERVTTGTATIQLQARFINSSPPFTMGDHEDSPEAGGFIFLEMSSDSEIIRTHVSEIPPWGYNGPTSIRADRICPHTGKKFRRIMKPRSFEEIMDGASIIFGEEEITHRVKNADRHLIPHPFPEFDPANSIILLNPRDDRVKRILEYQNAGGGAEITEQLRAGHLYPDNEPLSCQGCPPGVMVTRLKYKYTKGQTA